MFYMILFQPVVYLKVYLWNHSVFAWSVWKRLKCLHDRFMRTSSHWMVCLPIHLVFLLFLLNDIHFQRAFHKKLSFFYIVPEKISSVHPSFKLAISVFPHGLCKNNLCSFLVLSKILHSYKRNYWVFTVYHKATNAFRQFKFSKNWTLYTYLFLHGFWENVGNLLNIWQKFLMFDMQF